MTNRIGRRLSAVIRLLFFTGSLFGVAAAAGPVPESVRLTVVSPVHPVLIRNEHGVLLRLQLDVPADVRVSATGFSFQLAGTDDGQDVETLAMYFTADQEVFSAESAFGLPTTAADHLVFHGEQPLQPGRNVFWLSCTLKATAKPGHQVGAVCTEVATSSGSVDVPAPSGRQQHRIGVALRKHNDDGVHTYRIPALGTSAKGTLLCVYDMRRRMGRDLQEDIDIGLSRSEDGGRTWDPVRVIMDMGEYGGLPQEQNGCSDPGLIIDRQTGEIFCFAVWMNGKPGKHQWVDDGSEPGFEIGTAAQFLMVRSQDDGRTWSKPENLTRLLKQEAWWLLAPSPQQGIQLPDGTLVMPVQGRTGRESEATFATIMISRDHGATWTVAEPGYRGGNECQAAQLSDGSIMLNVRNDRERYRAVAVTRDLGQTWTEHPGSRRALIEPNCNGSLLRVNFPGESGSRPALLFANPHTQKGRTHHTIQVSFDDGMTWPESHHVLLDEGRGAGYPSLTQVDQESVGIVYEGSQSHLVFEKFTLAELAAGSVAGSEAIDLGNHRELFIDDYLIDSMDDVQLQVHSPVREEIAVTCDAPWEGNGCGYFTVLHDRQEAVYRMYYHAWQIPNGIEPGGPLTIGYFESADGIHWNRPSLGLCEFQGSRDNNIMLDRMGDGGSCHDFSPFIDENPDAKPEARYKATGAGFQTPNGVWAYKSPDGIHWTPMADKPVFTKGIFDSQNISFWSAAEQQYVLYYRVFSGQGTSGTRLVNRAVSRDFLNWTDEGTIRFPEGEGPHQLAQYYVSQIKPCERAPHLYLGFPARYVDHGLTASTALLPEWELRQKRMTVTPRYGTAVTDSVLITSRDGINFRQSNDVFLRPGFRSKDNWSYGDNYIAWHVVETTPVSDDIPRELSLYATESYFTGRTSRLRRYSLRPDGFGSVHAKRQQGEFRTKPLRFSGEHLSLNVATSAAGSVRVEILNTDGTRIKGFTLEECGLIYGDTLDHTVTWNEKQSVAALAGMPVVLRFVMQEADVYSLVFE